MITYQLNGEYHARLQLNTGLARQVFYGSGHTRLIAITLALFKASSTGLIKL